MYVTLPSHANRQEFPNNQANWFKIRLPHPLRLGKGWEVGLSSISLPDTRVNLNHLSLPGQGLWGMSQYTLGYTNKLYGDPKKVFTSYNMPLEALKEDKSIVDGVSFMKAILRWYDKKFTEHWTNYYTTTFHPLYGAQFLDNSLHTRPVFKCDKQDLLLDNSKIARHKFATSTLLIPHVGINSYLATQMGWFIKQKDGSFKMGPNLLMVLPGGKTPKKTEYDWLKNGRPLYYTTTTDNDKVTWILLSMRVSRKFLNLNVAFRQVVGEPSRSLHVYSDVGGSTIVGNRKTDLLREIKYDREGEGSFYFEPEHIQYLPVRNEVVELIEVQVAETIGTTGDLVKFGDGHTILTLHFQKVQDA